MRIELPEQVRPELVERTYRRSFELRQRAKTDRAKRCVEIGRRMAKARSPRLLLFLEHGAEHLQRMNDEQKSRFAQEGYAGATEYTEFATWREAFLLARDPRSHEDVHLDVFKWVYAAVAEVLGEA